MTTPVYINGSESISLDLQNSEFSRTNVIDRVFLLLVRMIEVLQKATAATSDRLKFLTDWQKAYTDQLDSVHSFTMKNGDLVDQDKQSHRDIRDELNRANSTYTEQLRSRRQVVSDDAKTLQTTVNQMSDAVNQQTSMATSLLQQLSTILGAIFK